MQFDQKIDLIMKEMAADKTQVSLITVYKNIPLAFDARLISYEDDTATFKVHKYQFAASVLVKNVFIQLDPSKNCIWARVVKMDPVKVTLGLSEFKDAGNSMNRRTFLRVEPEASIPVYLQIHNTRVMAELADISEEGISIFLDPVYLETPESEGGKFSDRFEILFQLPGDRYHPLTLKSAIRYAMKDTLSGKYRIGLQLYPDESTKSLINEYITHRKAATLQEIKSLYEHSIASGGLSG